MDEFFMMKAIDLSRAAVEHGNEGCDSSRMVFENSFWHPEVTAGVLRDQSLEVLKSYFVNHEKG